MMKNLISKILAFSSVALLLLSSCKKDGDVVTIDSSTTKVGTLSTSTTSPVLTKATLSATSVTFSTTASTYGYSAAVTYTLQLDTKGDNFATPKKEVVLGSTLSQSYTVQDFNNLLLGMKLATGVAAQVEARVKSSLSITAGVTYSNVITLNVTPFALTSYLYIVGAFQGWNASSPDSLVSAIGNGVYVGVINYTAGNREFLVLPAKNYNNKYATTESLSATAPTATVGYNANNNLVAPPTAGQYLVTLNLNTNTITFAAANTYSVIGSTTPGGNYSTDLDLTKYVNDVNGYWTGIVAQTAGAFKIRQNHDWTYSWGDISPANGKDATSDNGANINITVAGNYKITFTIAPTAIDSKFVPQKLTTYTAVKQ